MRLTAIYLAFCAATAVTATSRSVTTHTVTTPTDEGLVSTLAGLTEPVTIANIGKNTQTQTTTTTTSRRRKVRRVFSSTPQKPPMNFERLATLSFAALKGEGKQAENFAFKTARQTDQNLGMINKPATPQQVSHPPNSSSQTPKVATVAPPQFPPSSGANFVDESI